MTSARKALLAALLAAGPALAQGPPPDPAPAGDALAQSLRPSGPVTVTADRAEWEKGGAMLYAGNVSMVSDTLSMRGERLELRQKKAGEYEAILRGSPARLDHAGQPGNAEAPPVAAQARTLIYDTGTSMVQLSGAARLVRGTDEITGETIRYDVAARRIRAAGGEGGQVRIVIQPPPPKKGAAPVKP